MTQPYNISLQRTFDPPRTFAAAKARVDSNAAELRCWAAEIPLHGWAITQREENLTMNNPSFKSDIFYSVQNEDYQTELAVLHRIYKGSPQHVLMVASSGENALSLLTQDTIAQVHAVDINPAQLHLCELRRAALEHLTRDEQLFLLGADPSLLGAVGASERLSLFSTDKPDNRQQ